MRVVYSIGAKFAGGGIGTTAYHGVRGLHRHGMLHRLLCGSFRPTEIPRGKIRAMGLPSRVLRKLAVYDPSHRLSYLHNVLYDLWAYRLIEAGELFHVWGGHGLRSVYRARELGAITVVQWASSHLLHRVQLLREEYARWGLSFRLPRAALQRGLDELAQTNYVLIPSEYVRTTFKQQGVPEEKIIQIPFGVDTTRFRQVKKRASHSFRVLFVGTVSIAKGILDLLRAWQHLGWQDAELWVVGRLSSEASFLLREYTQTPGLRLLGHRTDIPQIYRQADVFAFPSIDEGSALVTYEALASGLPVVTTPNAGSVVRDGVEGFIVPIRDVDALATALERLRANERLRQEMGRAARERAEAFTWERHGDALAEVYRRLQAIS